MTAEEKAPYLDRANEYWHQNTDIIGLYSKENELDVKNAYIEGLAEGKKEKCLEQNNDEAMKENKEHNLLIDIIEAFTSQSLTDDGEMADTAREIAEILGIKNYR